MNRAGVLFARGQSVWVHQLVVAVLAGQGLLPVVVLPAEARVSMIYDGSLQCGSLSFPLLFFINCQKNELVFSFPTAPAWKFS